jgi:hypothetical protein
MKRNEIIEGLKDPKDNPCWKGYKPVGTKKKNGKTVPNCVPKESVQEEKQKVDPTYNVNERDKEGIKEMYGRKSNYYNPMDYERDQQRQMDYEKRDFKRREMEHELGHEDDPNFERNLRQQQMDRDRGPWYLKVNGKILKSKGEVKVFDWKKGANNYALAILKNRPELQGKIFLTKKMQDDSTDVAESKTTVKVPVSQKPRQGPLRPQTGAGKHNDKKKDQKQGKEKHKKPMYEQDYTADEMVDILSGKKTQAQVDAEKKAKSQTAPQAPKPTTSTPPKPAKEAAGELKVQKDDDNATILLNPTTGVQTQIDKKNPNAPKITQDETGKLKLQMPGSAQAAGGGEPKIVGKDVEVATPPMEDVANILKLAGL